jgi:hypothetical protein
MDDKKISPDVLQFSTPYEIVFGQHPRSSIAMFKQLAIQGIVNEEDLPIEILDTLFKHISMQSS